MELPYPKIDLLSEASRIYESDECDRLFAQARERFPRYNDEQTLDALDYIVDGLESACAGGYTEEQWQSIAENFGEHVQNGLT